MFEPRLDRQPPTTVEVLSLGGFMTQKCRRQPVSAVVMTYNRQSLIGTCLKALAFADELIVIDKSSTDATRDIAVRLCDRVIQIPWSAIVEHTRPFAISQCHHDWVLLMDDDECLSAEAVLFIDQELKAPRAEVYSFPLRDYILGQHREEAYYWPVRHVRLFRRGSVQPGTVAHAGLSPESGGLFEVPFESGACIHHSPTWTPRSGSRRRTGTPRKQVSKGTAEDQGDLIAFAHARLDFWAGSGAGPATEYTAAVAALRAVYDIVDRVKAWEQAQPATGAALFAEMCQRLEAEYETQLARIAKPHGPALMSDHAE